MLDLLLRHRSIRRFTDDPVDDADLRRAIAAGQAASTSSAIQAYGALHVRDAAVREQLVPLTGGQTKVARCGAFLVICGDVRRHARCAARHDAETAACLESFMLATIDATLFAQNLVIALESMGYGICYIGGLRNDLEAVDRLLAIPHGVLPLYGLCIGVPAEAPIARPRLDVDAVYHDGAFPDDDAVDDSIAAYDERYRAYLTERGADPAAWSARMAEHFRVPRRTALAAYYASKGARFDDGA